MGNSRVAEPDLDPDTLEGFRRGDPAAQRRVFDRYADRVYSIARHFLRGDDAAAKDAAQEAFVRMFPNVAFKVYRETGHALHWERPAEFARDLVAFVTG